MPEPKTGLGNRPVSKSSRLGSSGRSVSAQGKQDSFFPFCRRLFALFQASPRAGGDLLDWDSAGPATLTKRGWLSGFHHGIFLLFPISRGRPDLNNTGQFRLLLMLIAADF